jgi:hypothetical protein
MVKLTMLARVADGLPLAEGLDSDRQQDLEQYKQQAKTLFKKLSQGPPPPSRMSYESGPYFLHYMVGGGSPPNTTRRSSLARKGGGLRTHFLPPLPNPLPLCRQKHTVCCVGWWVSSKLKE